MIDNIKPCPFCGKQPLFTINDMGYDNGHGYPGNHCIVIKCIQSFCGVNPSVKVDDIYMETKEAIEKCIGRWNKRA